MITRADIDIYGAFFQQKTITEKYLGFLPISWTYSIVTYNADCTASLPFDLFDKVIVGILQVDEVLTIEQIGDILGMNLISDPKNGKYKDEAEYDILRAAIDSLVKFKMVSTGDIYYSEVKLTDIGKEYARKGMKFVTTENKEFRLYFDNTSGNHANAQAMFGRYNPRPITLKPSEAYLDENVMKEICASQNPEIYDPQKGNSFTNAKLNQKSYSYDLELRVAIYFDIETTKFRLFCLEPETKKEITEITKWLNQNYIKNITDHYFQTIIATPFAKVLPQSYRDALKETMAESNRLLESDPVNAITYLKNAYRNAEFVESLYFWKNLSDFVEINDEEVYLFINEPSSGNLDIINLLVRSRVSIPLFIVLQKDRNTEIAEQTQSLKNKCLTSPKKVFLLETDQLKNFAVWIKRSGKIYQYKNSDLIVTMDGKQVVIPMLQKSLMESVKSDPICSKVKELLAQEYLPAIRDNFIEYAAKQKELNENKIDADLISSYSDSLSKAQVFTSSAKQSQVQKTIIQQIEDEKNGLIAYQIGRQQLSLLRRLEAVKEQFASKEILDLNEVLKFKDEGIKIKNIIPASFEEIIKACDDFIESVKEREKYIRDEILAKTFIIDTNVFIEEPNILELIDKKNYVALNFMVVEELDRLKTREKTKEKAGVAIKKINTYLQESAKQKYPRVRKAKAFLGILPEEFQNKSGDNYILAVAYAYKDKNPVILTNDNNLQVKAQMLEIPVMNLGSYKESIKQIAKK